MWIYFAKLDIFIEENCTFMLICVKYYGKKCVYLNKIKLIQRKMRNNLIFLAKSLELKIFFSIFAKEN